MDHLGLPDKLQKHPPVILRTRAHDVSRMKISPTEAQHRRFIDGASKRKQENDPVARVLVVRFLLSAHTCSIRNSSAPRKLRINALLPQVSVRLQWECPCWHTFRVAAIHGIALLFSCSQGHTTQSMATFDANNAAADTVTPQSPAPFNQAPPRQRTIHTAQLVTAPCCEVKFATLRPDFLPIRAPQVESERTNLVELKYKGLECLSSQDRPFLLPTRHH